MTQPGIKERDDALDLFDQSPARRELIDQARDRLIQLFRDRSCVLREPYVTGDDALNILRDLQYIGDHRIVGAIFRPRSGWEYVRHVPSLDRACHGRLKAAWRWKGKT